MPESPPPGRGCIAVALIVIGALILLPSGLCTAILGIGALYEAFADPKSFLADLSDGGVIAGGVVIAAVAGFLLIRAGLSLEKRK